MRDTLEFLMYWPWMKFRHDRARPPSSRVIRGWYDLYYRGSARNEHGIAFTNNGYFSGGDNDTGAPSSLHDERHAEQLYRFLVELSGLRTLSGLDVAEIGCGLGGGASFVATTYRPNSMIGLDLSSEAIAFCRRRHAESNLSFVVGNAMDLPFETNQLDVVLNVESAHCYPDMRAFVSEVYRVLKPGGYFLITDLCTKRRSDEFLEALASQEWTEKQRIDITSNVIAAQEADSARRLALLEASGLPKSALEPLKDFAGCKGYNLHNKLVSGTATYMAFSFEKPQRRNQSTSL